MMTSSEDEMLAAGDPTQQLLSALGRFQRCVAKGEAGAPQEAWSDECMNHLIEAFELSRTHKWDGIIEALTDTARVLQSYENGECANDAVPFLKDSYEVLCLMVGDLIVGSVRSGIMDKWRQRFKRAAEELEAAGIALVSDEGEEGAGEPEPFEVMDVETVHHTADSHAESSPFELPEFGEQPEAQSETTPFEPLPELDDTLGIEKPAEEEPAPVAQESPFDDPFTFGEEAQEDAAQAQEAAPVDIPVLGAEQADGTAQEDQAMAEEPAAPEQPGASEQSDEAEEQDSPSIFHGLGVSRTPRHISDLLDALCAGLARIENQPGASHAENFGAIDDTIDILLQFTDETDDPTTVDVCRKMREVTQATAQADTIDSRFFDVGYGFCEAFVAAGRAPDGPVVRSWLDECTLLLNPEEEPAPEEARGAEEEPATFELPAQPAAEAPADEEAAAPAPEAETDTAAEAETAQEDWALDSIVAQIAADAGADAGVAEEQEEPPAPAAPQAEYEQEASSEESESEAPDEALTTESSVLEQAAALAPEPEDAAAETAVAEGAVAEDDGSPLSLLRIAQQAIAQGKVADAKTLALQVAASLAHAEVTKCEDLIHATETRLRDNETAIEEAREGVRQAEEEVEAAQQRVAEGQEALSGIEGRVTSIESDIGSIEERIAEIDEKIRALQEAREAEVASERQAREQLEETRAEQAEACERLEELQSEEQAAKEHKESALHDVATLEEERSRVEGELAGAHEALARQQGELADITRMAPQQDGGATDNETSAGEGQTGEAASGSTETW